MRLRYRILIPFIILAVFITVSILFAIVLSRTMRTTLEETLTETVPFLLAAEQLQTDTIQLIEEAFEETFEYVVEHNVDNEATTPSTDTGSESSSPSSHDNLFNTMRENAIIVQEHLIAHDGIADSGLDTQVNELIAVATNIFETLETSETIDTDEILEQIEVMEDLEHGIEDFLEEVINAEVATLDEQRLSISSLTQFLAPLIIGLFTTLVIFTVVVGVFLSSTISNALTQLKEAATRMGRGELDIRVELERNDEIGELATAFNQMASNLQSARDELATINQELEQRVQERTAELQVAMKEAQEASRLKDEFLATMSHELRTPLNAIIGFQGVIEMSGELGERNSYLLKRLRVNAERLLNLINDILDISRIESGRFELIPTTLSVNSIAQNVREQLGVLAEEKGLQMAVEVDPNMPEAVVVDEEALMKIITNLISNAVKFTEEGEVRMIIRRDDSNWQVVVRDTGIGIPAHKQEVIFERFRQVDGSSTRAYGGTGLGLAIVRQLALAMGGTVQVRSEIDKGSEFTVTLPLMHETLSQSPQEQSAL